MNCQSCGGALNGQQFCPNCGTQNNIQQPSMNQMPVQQPVYNQPSQQQMMNEQPMNSQPNQQQMNYQQPMYGQPGQQQMNNQQPMYGQPGQQQMMYNQQPELPMTFHMVYIVFTCLSILSSLAEFSASSILSIAFLGCMAYFLYQRKKIGYILMVISNVFSIIGGALMTLLGAWFLFVPTAALELGEVAAIFSFLGVFILFIGIGLIVYAICVLKYYQKRKHLFV